jgi:serine/threonine-protein kinase
MLLGIPGFVLIILPLYLDKKTDTPTKTVPTSRSFVAVLPETPERREVQSDDPTADVVQAESVAEVPPAAPGSGPYQHDPTTPQELIYGQFVKGELVGKGGMGTVYRCRSCVPGDTRIYALKILNEEWSTSEDFRARFEREADICRKLTHTNVVRAYERGEKEDRLWMVMDFIEGGELTEWLKREKRSATEIGGLFVQVCDGLAHAHNQDVVHRDLKPENILVVEGEQKPVIADFGLAKGKHYKTITKTNTTLGTPIYMPPEQVTGGKGGPRGDLYSLGCILYEALSGESPFPDKDVLSLLNKKLLGKMPPDLDKTQATPEMQAIVFKLLATSPDDRFQSAEELKQALLEALG